MREIILGAIISALLIASASFIAWRIQHGIERRERAFDASIAKVESLDDKLDNLGIQVALLVADGKNNGGKSGRDQIDAIRRSADDTSKRVQRIDDRLTEHLIRSESDSTRLNDHLVAVASGALSHERIS